MGSVVQSHVHIRGSLPLICCVTVNNGRELLKIRWCVLCSTNIVHLNLQNSTASYDFVNYDNNPTPDFNPTEPNSHGTSCAGEVGMAKGNGYCGVGVAYECSIGSEIHALMYTVLVEIIRDSKNKYFFQRSRIIMVEISRSRIIRITNYSVCTYMCAQVQPRFISRATTTLWSRRSRRKRLNHQSRLHCLPDKFRHLGHGPRCDSDGLGPNGP